MRNIATTIRMHMTRYQLVAVLFALLLAAPAIAESPEATKFYNQGIDAYTQGNVPSALKLFEQAAKIDPSYADAHYNIGSIHYQNNNYDMAEMAFRNAVKYNPTDFQAKYNLALSLEQKKNYKEALSLYREIPATDLKFQRAQEKTKEISNYLSGGTPQSTAQAQANQPTSQTVYQSQQPGNTAANPVTQQQADAQRMSQLAQGDPATAAIMREVQTFSRGFFGPTGMTIGPGGFLFVANYSKHSIYKVGANGEKEVFIQGSGLQGPVGLTYNPRTKDLYVANYLKNTVSRITSKGEVNTLASGLKKPYNLFLDTMNNVLYVSEQETNTVSKIQL